MNLQNRIAMAPMTRGFAMNGEVDQSHVRIPTIARMYSDLMPRSVPI